jgi:hypothetical protein
MVVAVVALAMAMVGSAIAGTDGLSNKITKSKVKKISKKQAKKQLKANVAGSHVNLADAATSAGNATSFGGKSPSSYETLVGGQIDPPGFTTITNTGVNTINTASITVPEAGTLVISGKYFINNNSATAGAWQGVVLLDGTNVSEGGFTSYFELAADGVGGDEVTPSYALARPVSAGTHTVEVTIDGAGQPYNIASNDLVLEYSPGGSLARSSGGGSGGGDGSDG